MTLSDNPVAGKFPVTLPTLAYRRFARGRWGRACIIRNLDCWFHRCGAALVTEIKYQPPFWVHALLWAPPILAVTLGPLRGLKGLLIALKYHYKASERRLAPRFGVC